VAHAAQKVSGNSQPQSLAFDEEAWKAVIGHWPAFFVTWYWLLYRKMWDLAALYFLLPLILAFAIGLVAGISVAEIR
jgi:hypothetical protein